MKFGRPVVVSISTLPSRISKIGPCLDSLLAGDVVPDKILLALPRISRRENRGYSIPEFLRSRDFCRSIIEIVDADHDWGPGTKLIGSLDVIPKDCYLILADDDVRYRPNFLAGLLRAQRSDHASSFSWFANRSEGLTVGHGCDGFSFWSPNLSGIKPFAEKYVDNTDLFFHDDLWISFYLASKGIPVKSLAHLLGSGLIYERVHEINALCHLTGDLGRLQISRRGVRRLLREAPMPARTKLIIRLISVYDKLVYLFRSHFSRLERVVRRLGSSVFW